MNALKNKKLKKIQNYVTNLIALDVTNIRCKVHHCNAQLKTKPAKKPIQVPICHNKAVDFDDGQNVWNATLRGTEIVCNS